MGQDQTLKEKAEQKLNSGKAGQIGDPVSLKNESSDRVPAESEEGAKKEGSNKTGHKTLKELAQANPTMLGDPVSLKAETSNTEPTEQDRGSLGAPNNEIKSKI